MGGGLCDSAAEASYRTESIAIAAWKLDERIAKNSDAWPIIVGINVIKGNWDICALRLDSPEGQAWSNINETPKFLFAGEEVFLDTMVEGNKTCLWKLLAHLMLLTSRLTEG